ncbi:MAG: hypothetical protein R2709_01410 [Marmoricola sp.]
MAAPSITRTLAGVAGLGAVAGLGTLAYSAGWEVRNFVVRRAAIAALPPGAQPIKVLHVTDLHLVPRQGRKRAWLASLADLEPDLVINTGDNLAHMGSVAPLVEGFGRLLDVPGVFVFGSNDYFSPRLRNPVKYLLPDDGERNVNSPMLPSRICALSSNGTAGSISTMHLDSWSSTAPRSPSPESTTRTWSTTT